VKTVKMKYAIRDAGNKLVLVSVFGALAIVAVFFISIVVGAHRDATAIIGVQVSSELRRVPFDVNRMSIGLEDVSLAMSKSANIDVAVLVEKDGRLISGNPLKASRLTTSVSSKKISLPTGETVTVKTSLDYGGAIKNALLAITVLSLVFLVLLRAYQLYLRKVVFRLTHPLTELTEQVLSISKNLPESAKSKIIVADTEIEECETLASAANELLNEISEKVEELRSVSKSEAKFELASMLVHDMKSPLATLKAGLEVSKGIEPKIQESLLEVVSDLVKLFCEIDTIRAAEESEIEKTRLGIVDNDLAEEIEAFLKKKSVLFEARKVQVNFRSESTSVPVEMNSLEFQRILSNLVENALAAGATHIELSNTNLDGMCRLSIADDGSGIPAEKQSSIFEKGVSNRGSSGLGLAFVKEKIEAWGGFVSVTSKAGEGTTFDLIFKLSVIDSQLKPKLSLNAKSNEEVQHG
tara:strand:+ start:88530 stop:89930 length:1401 start_codon:yes stop_codon:yes gene_type:complete